MLNRRRLALLLVAVLALAGLGAAFSRLGTAPGGEQARAPAPASAAPAAATPAAPAAPAVTGDLAARLVAMERAMDRRRQELGIPGAALAVVRADEVIYLKGLGVKDLERNLPVTPDTRFQTGSSTKSFTAMLAVMSQDDGRLSLDDPVRRHLPYFKLQDREADAGVTLRDLLSHRSGMGEDAFGIWYGSDLDREQVIRAGMAAPTVAPLGKEFHYSNIGYTAAGEAVARAQGVSWERLVEERIFRPLGMTASDTSIAVMQKSPDFSLGYTPGPRNSRMISVDISNVAPAGGVDSTARDMAQWLRLVLGRGVYHGKRLVSERGFAELFSRQMPMGRRHYCLGWMEEDWRGHPVYSHGGAIDGFSGMVAVMPDRKLGMVLLTNVAQSDLLFEGAKIVWDHLAPSTSPSPTSR